MGSVCDNTAPPTSPRSIPQFTRTRLLVAMTSKRILLTKRTYLNGKNFWGRIKKHDGPGKPRRETDMSRNIAWESFSRTENISVEEKQNENYDRSSGNRPDAYLNYLFWNCNEHPHRIARVFRKATGNHRINIPRMEWFNVRSP